MSTLYVPVSGDKMLNARENQAVGYRLIPSKYPTIDLFDDVVNPEDFEVMYQLQALTNPRIRDEVGDVSLIKPEEIPYHCERGRSYAVAAFTHINRDGSRFADGSFGMLYIGDTEQTALKEVMYHQRNYWTDVNGLHYDRLVFRALRFTFDDDKVIDVRDKPMTDPIYDLIDYSAAQALGRQVRQDDTLTGIRYNSVRNEKGSCWAMSTPQVVSDVIQCFHAEMIWNGKEISQVEKIYSMA
ncbi:RES family NAD+ phosphorylase [Salinivibrio sp. PR6]|uniref:RES family NAD+ phosphorylase n=1 Tax=Salinivibrio sp. PR6 TaxID=1909485 RepID=UPI001F5212B1|nr:RES family NAD+ phosphorylase [Salinivibrio sp. PR6]